MFEPARDTDFTHLEPRFAERLQRVMARMRARGFDPVLFEGRRSLKRQEYLYSIGRTRQKNRKPVTWTLQSKHLRGLAADIISKKRGWMWPEFYTALGQCARIEGLQQISREQCHIEAR